LVAHCDTIIRKDGVDLYYEGGILRNAQGVLGADDRAGVYGILHTLATHGAPSSLVLHEL
jgi:di/tripeptidase